MTLTVNRLHFAYQQTPILRDISFSVPRGKLVGIVGPNGCGKSTLLKLLSGQMKAQRGEILLKGAVPGPKGGLVVLRSAAKKNQEA